jgi:hypothetical protein
LTAAASAAAAAAILQQKQAPVAAVLNSVPAAASAAVNSMEPSQTESSGGGVRARFEMFRKKFTSSGQPVKESNVTQQQQGSEVINGVGVGLPPVVHLQGGVGLQYQQAANLSNNHFSKHAAADAGKFFSDDESES